MLEPTVEAVEAGRGREKRSVRRAEPSAPPAVMPPAPLPAALTALFAALVCASAGIPDDVQAALDASSRRSVKSLGPPSLPPGCLYEGRWHTEGATVATGEACLHCVCGHGALTCRRRACAPLPDPPPRRCHVLHRRGSCCPELHCPDGIILMEHGASARYESTEDIAAPASVTHACAEGGTIYAAGSAMRSAVACEQCFCLGGARRCVRPRCLPPPQGCRPRPAPGACCPQRYYCEHRSTKPPVEKHPHDCKVENKWITEGERVVSSKKDGNCTQCFCLRGTVQCQPLSCAPPLLGCKPLLRSGECCAHQYHCEHTHHGSHILTLSSNALSSTRSDDRAFHISKSSKQETTTKNTLANIFSKNTPTLTATINHLVSTTKVKRKTSDPPPEILSKTPVQNTTVTPISTTTTQESTTPAKPTTTTEVTSHTTTELTTEATSTEQPEGSVRIMINGTINCTAELSSTSLPLNITFNETEQITSESHPRIPLIDVSNLEDHTFSANDIITDRTVNGGFDENESFVINVTSSLMTNTTRTTMKPPVPTVPKVSVPTDIVETNSSKKTKGDYDYDYTEPTLPPSLPNLKIIPFVAADAVLEDDHPKQTLTYPILEREDKFPVYYPSADAKDSAYETRREDLYRPTQYPVFITDKPDHELYPSLTPDVDLTNTRYSNVHTDLDSSANDFPVSGSLSNRKPDIKSVTQQPLTTTTFKLETPVVNLFSPPVETEGGFLPKGPTGLIDEYFAVFPSTPSGPAVPHLTTSMQLDITKGECVSGDGRHVPEGDTITLACSECTCAWGELHCSPRPCHTPAGCRRRPATSNAADLCCGELICDEDNKTTQVPEVSTIKFNTTNISESKSTTESVIENDYVTDYQLSTSNNSVHNDTSSKKEETVPQSHDSMNPVKIKTADNVTTTSTTYIERFNNKSITTLATPIYKTTTQSNNQSLEYEDDEDEGFSFGSVLKLLLSDNYETTTTPPKKISTTTKVSPPLKSITTTRRPRPPLPSIQPPKPSLAPFVPLPMHPYIPSKKNQNPINRIDHLVLGEATAIKNTTPRVVTTTFWPKTTNKVTSRPTTERIAIKPTEMTKEETYTTQDAPRPPGGMPGLGPGLLKLAGCNIYGRMYRVGRIITELSTPCQECWCTEFGVQCKQLKC